MNHILWIIVGTWSFFQWLIAGRGWYLATNDGSSVKYPALGHFFFFLLFLTAPVSMPIVLSVQAFNETYR